MSSLASLTDRPSEKATTHCGPKGDELSIDQHGNAIRASKCRRREEILHLDSDVVIVWLTRYVSLGSIAATVALPPAAWITGEPIAVVLAAAGSGGLILFRHRGNIRRLREGTERRMGVRV